MDNNKWHVGKPGCTFIYGPHGEEIARVSEFQFTEQQAKELAAQIVREHNTHDELVAALRAIADAEPAGAVPTDGEMTGWQAAHAKLCGYARAALAKATAQ